MARVYSARLAVGTALGGGAGIVATVPAGVVWVLRSMSAAAAGAGLAPLSGFQVLLGTDVPIWGVGPLCVASQNPYEWSGRQVLNAGDDLTFSSADTAPWALIVSGYSLALP